MPGTRSNDALSGLNAMSRPACSRTSARTIRGGYVSAMLACLFVFGTACSSQKTPSEFGEPRESQVQSSVPAVAGGENVGQDQLLQAQANSAKKAEVLFTAPVYKLLPDDRQGTPHQRFLLQLSNGSTVLVAHNTKMAPPVPLRAGDIVTIRGEYIWNEKGGVVHWTHHTDTPRHIGGYIDFDGQRYQ